ncbi:hypothetical protein SY27_14120 [Flavobacterium sp. 316]|uniref:DUF4132 domain-containing protein n=1 Tax=Flavobacterium sp. 316 TaxID=1603293 RepID=UPI0005E99540|nr:DUF4132 domain-containing protein [Flavobacterium sp. 316]KIX20263.1 hypothetical protein SY27_14120 [Flavobacterium sp. 316]
MSIELALAKNVIENPLARYKRELEECINNDFILKQIQNNKLEKVVAEFGCQLVTIKNNYSYYISLGSEESTLFEKWVTNDMWDNPKYYDLLLYFFGETNAKYVKEAWNKLPYKAYQTGYARRSFRAPNHNKILLVNQVNFLRTLLLGSYLYQYRNNIYYNLTIEEQIKYDTEITNPQNQFMIWSAAIDAGDQKVYQLIEDIIFNKETVGKVSKNIIKALLNSEKKSSWELVEKLLLAAQRQEGLRQTVLESLDETSIEALEYMINVIIENKLTRFSSVVRAIDTWTGLGWEAEKETTVRNILQFASHYFANQDSIPAGIQSKNNNEVYMALWVQGVLDIQKTVPYLHDLLENGSIEKKCLAIRFTGETNDPYIEMPIYYKALETDNLQILAFVSYRLKALLEANTKGKYYINNPDYPNFFQKVYDLTQSITVKEKTFEGKVFSWSTVKFERDTLYASAMALVGENQEYLQLILDDFDNLSIHLREKITREILGKYYCYSFYALKNNTTALKEKPTEFQREFASKVIKDRGEAIMASAICTLSAVELNKTELDLFEDLLKRKNSTLKKNIIEMLIKQDDSILISFVEGIIEKGNVEQRMSALDLILQLQKAEKLPEKIKEWIKAFSEKSNLSERESKFLEQINPSNDIEVLSQENGYGFYDPNAISTYALPEIAKDSFYTQVTQKNKYGFSKPYETIKEALDRLYNLFEANKDYEYEIEYYDNTREKVLLGNNFSEQKRLTDKVTPEERFVNYPLHTVWENWYLTEELQPIDLFLLSFATACDRKVWRDILEEYVFYYHNEIPNPKKDKYYWSNPLFKIINALKLKFPFKEKQEYLIDACSKLFSNLPQSVLEYEYKPEKNNYYRSSDRGNGFQSESYFGVFLEAISLNKLTTEQQHKVWNLYRWYQLSGLKENYSFIKPPLYMYCVAYENKYITEGELYEGILDGNRLSLLTGDKNNRREHDSANLKKNFPFLLPMIDKIRKAFLDIEVKRGDANTSVTHLVQRLEKIYGANRFVELLENVGKANIYKGYIYSWGYNEMSKQKLFSFLLKRCFPLQTDTQETFNTLIQKSKLTEERLVQAAIYAPQWQKLISNYLDWKGLDEGIWWLHAHTKTSSYSDVNSELESEVAKYSAIDLQDFKNGAVDKDWFISSYKQLGKAKWEILYDAAKFITDGNGHRRARLYSDTLTGSLKIREVTAKVKDKRDQDYLRVYGLVPLSKTNPEKDVLQRYEYLQQFKKESKEFGSMKQTSEALALSVAMENLARNAGYVDPMRLTWAMETKQVQQILSKDTAITFDDVTISLVINQEGKADLEVTKGDKKLKAIPAKLKKEKELIELTSYRKTMREQWSRSRKGLEEAMVRGDAFTLDEMTNLFEHPVISKHLEKLVFVANDTQVGFFSSGNLVAATGEIIPLDQNPTFRIAHCYDLHANAVWTDFQSYCFDNKLVQPFKQVFRELYVPTPDELVERAISRRYAGHQVHPKQTLALLKNKGWKVDYEEGLQKVFHAAGFQVKLYAMADWFSPADVESPTLETIEFHSLKDYKNIPFEDINPRIFSEVMRDIDLVVSVAHVGGVDPEASHSSIEMRAVLLRETLRLFKINNVEVKESHALITGTMANYSVHLGSAVVHQTPGKYLSILPIHSQHRGRLFIPFADDDPKSAEVMSKVLLFAKDNEIQDPTILTQIDKKIAVTE